MSSVETPAYPCSANKGRAAPISAARVACERSAWRRRVAMSTGPQEREDRVDHALRLVLGDERVGVVDQDDARVRQPSGQALGEREPEELVFARPGEQHRLRERAQLLSSLEGDPVVDAAEEL